MPAAVHFHLQMRFLVTVLSVIKLTISVHGFLYPDGRITWRFTQSLKIQNFKNN